MRERRHQAPRDHASTSLWKIDLRVGRVSAWVLGRDPSKRIICASYSENLASKHAGDCRTVMESDWYRRTFPGTRISRDKNMELNYVTTRQGGRYSTSVGGTLTGRGGSLIIVDDPINPEGAMSEARRSAVNDWFHSTLLSRLDSRRDDVIIVIMQRLFQSPSA